MCFLPSTRMTRADPQTGHETNGIDLLFADVERRLQGCPSGQACPSGNALEGGRTPATQCPMVTEWALRPVGSSST